MELSVFGLLRTRDMEVARYKEFNIPIEWMLDSGLVGKVLLEPWLIACKECNLKFHRPLEKG